MTNVTDNSDVDPQTDRPETADPAQSTDHTETTNQTRLTDLPDLPHLPEPVNPTGSTDQDDFIGPNDRRLDATKLAASIKGATDADKTEGRQQQQQQQQQKQQPHPQYPDWLPPYSQLPTEGQSSTTPSFGGSAAFDPVQQMYHEMINKAYLK